MKKILLCIIALAMSTFFTASAQEAKGLIPAASTGQRIEQDFGLGTISVNYYRPNTKGRKIFGNLEPYGQVWRTGANNATTIKFTDTVQLEGHTVLPGTYGLFTIPGTTEWTVILNKNANQWGAYTYDEKQDLIRFKVKASKPAKKVETLTIQFADVQEESCLLQIQWENAAIDVRITTKVVDRIIANIQAAMKSDKKPYFAAVWLYNHNRNTDQALALIQEADKGQPSAFTKYWLAKLQLKTGDKNSAKISATEGLKLATEQKNQEYIRLNTAVLKESQ